MKTMPVCSPRHEEEDGPSRCLRFGSFSLASLCLILWGMASESELGSSTGIDVLGDNKNVTVLAPIVGSFLKKYKTSV